MIFKISDIEYVVDDIIINVNPEHVLHPIFTIIVNNNNQLSSINDIFFNTVVNISINNSTFFNNFRITFAEFDAEDSTKFYIKGVIEK